MAAKKKGNVVELKPKTKAAAKQVKQLLKLYDSVRVKLGDLEPDAGNPREMSKADFENLIKSLDEFGLVQPFVARAEDKRIVGGHQRGKAVAEYLRRQGVPEDQIAEQEITVLFLPGLSESKCRALNLALNRVHGEWAFELLPDYISGIESGDLMYSGFAEDEIKDIVALGSLPPPNGDDDPDAMLASMKLAFAFKVASAEEAELCKQVLASYGMTGPKDMAVAFVAAMRAAKKRVKVASGSDVTP
jgi:hypothetical protein